MRINQSYTTTRHDIRVYHIFEKCRFSHSGFSDDIDMSSSIDRLDTKLECASTKIGDSYRGIWHFSTREIMRWFKFSRRHPIHSWRFYIQCRQMDESCELCRRKNRSIFWKFRRNIAVFFCIWTRKMQSRSFWMRKYRKS